MKKLVVLLLLLFLLVGGLYWITSKKEVTKKEVKWPMEKIQSQVADIKPDQVNKIVFDGLYKTRNLTKTDEITPFLEGLREAVYPGDPDKGLPTDNMMQIKLILKDGRSVGPFGFSIEKASHAFGKKFAEAWNKTFSSPKIPID